MHSPERSEPAIDLLDRTTLAGSITSDTSDPIRVELTLDGEPIAATWATRYDESNARHTFRFNFRDVWQFCPSSRRLGVRVPPDRSVSHSATIPEIRTRPSSSPDALFTKLKSGFIFNQFGRLQLSKLQDEPWRAGILALYRSLNDHFQTAYGSPLIACYGTMLGAVRSNDFIGHDHDFDAAYISSKTDAISARAELCAIANDLIALGFKVTARRSCIWVYNPTDTTLKIDIFHLFFDAESVLQIPFGVAGDRRFERSDFLGYGTATIGQQPVDIIRDPEAFLERLYGQGWRVPNPGFNWDKDRIADNQSAWLSVTERAAVYWAAFYTHERPRDPSDFADAILRLPDCPSVIVDVCCGDGADMLKFGAAGKTVIGFDASPEAIAAAHRRLAEHGRPVDVTAHVSGISDGTLPALLADHRPPNAKVLFFARFVLHAITARAQEALLRALKEASTAGDTVAFEFRTLKDEPRKKRHKPPFRRYIEPDIFLADLKRFGFTPVTVQQGNGFARYGNEDPHVARVIARRRGPSL